MCVIFSFSSVRWCFENQSTYACSSQRSIKRKRFDDEIVQYSIGAQSTQLARIRSRRQSILLTQLKEPEGGATPVPVKPESLPVSAIPSKTLVNTNCEPKTTEAAKSIESLNQHTAPLPSSPVTTVPANNITTATTATAANTVATAVTAIVSATSTVTSTQQTISNISRPVLSPTLSNSTPMIPQVPSIQPSTIVPAAASSPAPRKYKQNFQ